MLTEDTIVDLIQILPDYVIQVRRSNRIFRDTTLISSSYQRYLLDPAIHDLTDPLIQLDSRLSSIITVLWTKDVIDARKKHVADVLKAETDKINAGSGGLNG